MSNAPYLVNPHFHKPGYADSNQMFVPNPYSYKITGEGLMHWQKTNKEDCPCCYTPSAVALCSSKPWETAFCCRNQENSTWTCGRIATAINLTISAGVIYAGATVNLSAIPGASAAMIGIGIGSMGLNLLIPTIHAIWISCHRPDENAPLLPV